MGKIEGGSEEEAVFDDRYEWDRREWGGAHYFRGKGGGEGGRVRWMGLEDGS